jgi:nitroimidazol reductase NimA-like FMN-containing flavoprotein (pyridoxamine 5'-phosphate oxidase superfamily)
MAPDKIVPNDPDALHDPGDVGRRVALRRKNLGMTRDELAAHAGMAPAYVAYLEEHPAHVSPGAVLRLAVALDTTAAELLGEGIDLPPGRGPRAPHPVLEILTADECTELLAPGGIGRVVLADAPGPVALPVNFAVLDGDIVFRTMSDSPLATAEGSQVGFEIDRIDDAMREGWSVMVMGRLRRIVDPDELEVARSRPIEPWAGGERDVYLRLTPEKVSGRLIRTVT